jgi:hypothetical protein
VYQTQLAMLRKEPRILNRSVFRVSLQQVKLQLIYSGARQIVELDSQRQVTLEVTSQAVRLVPQCHVTVEMVVTT